MFSSRSPMSGGVKEHGLPYWQVGDYHAGAGGCHAIGLSTYFKGKKMSMPDCCQTLVSKDNDESGL